MAKEFQLSVDARKLVEAYEAAPNKVEDMVRLQLKIAVERIRKYASKHHRYTTRTGNLERNGVDGAVMYNTGFIWVNTDKVPYARAIHEGRPQMTIVPRRSDGYLRWVNKAGDDFVFAKRVTIPTLKPDPFLYQAADHEMPAIQKSFAKELQELIKEL